MEPDFEQHLASEGIEYYEREVPDRLWPLMENSGKGMEDPGFIDFNEEEVILYRGDRQGNLKDLMQEDGSLRREFPIYFIESRSDAVERYAGDIGRKGYLVEISVPFESIDYLGEQRENEVERHEIHNLEPGKIYYLKSFRNSIELAASYIPRDWINSIESLDRN